MIELIECFECGGKLSPNANPCPHCKQNPHPCQNKCIFCNYPIKRSEGISSYFDMHKTCFHKHIISNPEINYFNCMACGTRLEYSKLKCNPRGRTDDHYSDIYEYICNFCGHSHRDVYSCTICGRSILQIDAITLFDNRNPNVNPKKHLLHKCCYDLGTSLSTLRRIQK